MRLTATFKRSFLVFLFGDLLCSLLIFALIHWLKIEILLLHKKIYFPGYHLLLLLWNFLKGFENLLPKFV